MLQRHSTRKSPQQAKTPLVDASRCRASRNRGLGAALHWLLYTEWEDPLFGPRVQRVHVAFQAAAEAAQVRKCVVGLICKKFVSYRIRRNYFVAAVWAPSVACNQTK